MVTHSLQLGLIHHEWNTIFYCYQAVSLSLNQSLSPLISFQDLRSLLEFSGSIVLYLSRDLSQN